MSIRFFRIGMGHPLSFLQDELLSRSVVEELLQIVEMLLVLRFLFA